ncbi:hypothetical protein KSP39_PZI018013 [Platanthera zijinensis]|uniref:Uncharacterized protein n=1 Tax=Platanthera zijinensis TaxID=2320716 RepID=A0AAP0B2G3_9ASPA
MTKKITSSSTSYFPEARARFKHHSFLQDYQELLKTGEAKEGFSKQRNLENEDSLKKSLREGGEALASDGLPSICQGSGIGLNRAVGKRNVSWQDQLALRV